MHQHVYFMRKGINTFSHDFAVSNSFVFNAYVVLAA